MFLTRSLHGHGVPYPTLLILLDHFLDMGLEVTDVLTRSNLKTVSAMKDRYKRTSEAGVHWSLGSSLCRIAHCEARLKRKARS